MHPALTPSLVLAPVFAFAVWSSDFVTLQRDRTICTAECSAAWQGDRCTGQLMPGKRSRFRALKAHDEVLFWTAGSSEASGKYTGCKIVSGREWRCPANGAESGTVTLEMKGGRPSKWRWHLLQWGWPAGSEADPVAQAAAS